MAWAPGPTFGGDLIEMKLHGFAVAEGQHPVTKRLPVHPADLGGLRSRCPIQHGSNRQKAPDLIAVFRPPRKPAHLNR